MTTRRPIFLLLPCLLLACATATPPPPAASASKAPPPSPRQAEPEAKAEPEPKTPPAPVIIEDRETLWARLVSARPQPEEQAADVFPELRLSPDATKIHAYREHFGHEGQWELVEIDLVANSGPRTLAETGTDQSTLEYVDGLLYASASVVDYRTHRVLRFDLERDAAPVTEPALPEIVESFEATPEGLLYERDGALFGLAPGAEPVELLPAAPAGISGLVSLGEGRAVATRPLTLDEDPRETRDILLLLSWAPGFEAPKVAELLREDTSRDILSLQAWTDEAALIVEARDKNDDGEVNYLDGVAFSLRALDLRDGTRRTLVGDDLDLSLVDVHPSGIVMLVERDSSGVDPLSRLSARDLEQGLEHELLRVEGDVLNWSLSAGWTHLVYAKLRESDGEDGLYSWKDLSELHVAAL